jgi:acyl-ACP thioesterase
MAEPGAAVLLSRPSSGRVFESGRRVRLGDVDPAGRCRLDAVVRYLQDIARDDSDGSGLRDPMGWVVRRTMVEVREPAGFEEWLDIATWASGSGGRWAERRTSISGDGGASIEAATLWVRIDTVTGRPIKLGDEFFEIYGEACGDRRVSARTTLSTTPAEQAESVAWEVRHTDLDLLGHVNNAAQWVPVEEVLERCGLEAGRVRAELEHGPGIERADPARLHWVVMDGGADTWLTTGEVTGSAARVRPL